VIQRIDSCRKTLAAVALFGLSSAVSAVHAQRVPRDTDSEPARELLPSNEAEATSEQATLAAGLTVEEVVVYGERSLHSLRQEVYDAEEAFYNTYNAVNTNDEFDISCDTRKRLGSRMLFRVCEARFVKDLNEDLAQAMVRGDPLPPINPIMMAKGRLLLADMQTIAREHPAVLQSLMQLADIRKKFDAEHERRCGGRILFCRR